MLSGCNTNVNSTIVSCALKAEFEGEENRVNMAFPKLAGLQMALKGMQNREHNCKR